MKYVLVRFGGGWGTQVAVIIAEREEPNGHGHQLRVRKWKGNSRAWTGPVWLLTDRVKGEATVADLRKYRVDVGAL